MGKLKKVITGKERKDEIAEGRKEKVRDDSSGKRRKKKQEKDNQKTSWAESSVIDKKGQITCPHKVGKKQRGMTREEREECAIFTLLQYVPIASLSHRRQWKICTSLTLRV